MQVKIGDSSVSEWCWRLRAGEPAEAGAGRRRLAEIFHWISMEAKGRKRELMCQLLHLVDI